MAIKKSLMGKLFKPQPQFVKGDKKVFDGRLRVFDGAVWKLDYTELSIVHAVGMHRREGKTNVLVKLCNQWGGVIAVVNSKVQREVRNTIRELGMDIDTRNIILHTSLLYHEHLVNRDYGGTGLWVDDIDILFTAQGIAPPPNNRQDYTQCVQAFLKDQNIRLKLMGYSFTI